MCLWRHSLRVNGRPLQWWEMGGHESAFNRTQSIGGLWLSVRRIIPSCRCWALLNLTYVPPALGTAVESYYAEALCNSDRKKELLPSSSSSPSPMILRTGVGRMCSISTSCIGPTLDKLISSRSLLYYMGHASSELSRLTLAVRGEMSNDGSSYVDYKYHAVVVARG